MGSTCGWVPRLGLTRLFRLTSLAGCLDIDPSAELGHIVSTTNANFFGESAIRGSLIVDAVSSGDRTGCLSPTCCASSPRSFAERRQSSI